ncbi:MAG TPA: hypothetical protein VLT36_25355, partial [Candidatus Dormibacteraeota bacterium]|nr:hypothetical protein [Candidatus Dormibacteraeota bacterium]
MAKPLDLIISVPSGGKKNAITVGFSLCDELNLTDRIPAVHSAGNADKIMGTSAFEMACGGYRV